MTNDFLYPNNSKIYEKGPRYNKTSLKRTNFASPLALRYVEVSLYQLRTQFYVSCWRRDRHFYVIGATQGKGNTFTA